MLVADDKGNELLDIINIAEESADKQYEPVNHCLAVVKIENDYLMGWNKWRQQWEIFGGCREEGESLRECIIRECKEEVEKLAFYKDAKGKENIAPIDEKLLEYWA